jgi:hypothetical protein
MNALPPTGETTSRHQYDTRVALMKICYIGYMHQIITAKLKLPTTPEQFPALRATHLAYRDALSHVSRYAFAHGKMSYKVSLQEGTYQELGARYHLPAQMACSIPRQVGATYKALWTRATANTEARAAGPTKKRYTRNATTDWTTRRSTSHPP